MHRELLSFFSARPSGREEGGRAFIAAPSVSSPVSGDIYAWLYIYVVQLLLGAVLYDVAGKQAIGTCGLRSSLSKC